MKPPIDDGAEPPPPALVTAGVAATGGLLAAGTRIGDYQIRSLIGEGGMSIVYAAVDVRTDQPVALKILRPDMARVPATVQRFFREAQATVQLAHPGIAAIYATGVDEATAAVFIAMEHVDGPSLGEHLARAGGVLDVIAVADLGAQLAETLAAAHAAGIVHRDIKPDNILIVAQPGGLRTKLVDFGIAKLRADAWGSGHTRTGMLLGTPGYMAPEQATARGEIDGRTDIYALGCVLYQCLCGEAPFADHEGMAVLVAHLNSPPPPLGKRAPWVPAAVDALVMRMLAKSPAQRPQTMLEVRDALDPIASPLHRPTREHLVADLKTRERAAQRTIMVGAAEPALLPSGAVPTGPSKTMMSTGAAARPLPRGTPPGAFRDTAGAAADVDTWAVIGAVAPSAFRDDQPLLKALLSLLFGRATIHGRGALALYEPSFAAAPGRRFFATFVTGRAPTEAPTAALGRLETRMFEGAVQPLAEHVARLDAAPGTVVIAIVDGAELGPGVGEVILTCRRRYGVAVVPLYVGELRRVAQTGQLRQLFQARVVDLHAHDNPFSMSGPSTDPTRCVGMGAQVSALVSLVSEGGRIVSVSGAPRCGKSTLLGLVEYACDNDLGGRVFVYVRCTELPAGDPVALVEHVRSRIAGAEPAAPSIPAKVATFVREQRLVIILEDADWLVRMSAPDYPDAERRAQVRALWTALADNVRTHRNTVIVTSVRGLGSLPPADTFTPPPVRSVVVAPLDAAGARRVVDELGRSIGLVVGDDAMARLHRESGGNVFVLRGLCAAAVERVRQRAGRSPLEAMTIEARDVAGAAAELAGTIRTFHRHIMELLDEGERRVLHHVARKRPRSVRAVRRALPDVAVIPALAALEDMGYVRHERGRHRVAVPLLADWLRKNLDPAPAEGEHQRTRRVTYLALGASLTALLLGIYWTWLASERVLTRGTGAACAVSVDHPRRAAAGETARLHVLHTCPAPAVAGEPAPNVRVRAVMAAVSMPAQERFCAPDTTCTFDVTALEQASPSYQLVVDAGGARADVVIARDALGEARRVLASGVKLAALLPLLLGSFLAYQRELRGVLRRLLRLGRGEPDDKDAASPAGN
jgi:eukaryotic-like serine/threonine-protein kinase